MVTRIKHKPLRRDERKRSSTWVIDWFPLNNKEERKQKDIRWHRIRKLHVKITVTWRNGSWKPNDHYKRFGIPGHETKLRKQIGKGWWCLSNTIRMDHIADVYVGSCHFFFRKHSSIKNLQFLDFQDKNQNRLPCPLHLHSCFHLQLFQFNTPTR